MRISRYATEEARQIRSWSIAQMLKTAFLMRITGPRNGKNINRDSVAGGKYITASMGIKRATVKTLVYC